MRGIALTAHVARAIYEGENSELGLLRGASAFSPALRKLEPEFEGDSFYDAEGSRAGRPGSRQKECPVALGMVETPCVQAK